MIFHQCSFQSTGTEADIGSFPSPSSTDISSFTTQPTQSQQIDDLVTPDQGQPSARQAILLETSQLSQLVSRGTSSNLLFVNVQYHEYIKFIKCKNLIKDTVHCI